jgi:hypothetical protein
MIKQEVVFCKSVFEKVKSNFDEQEIWASEDYYRTLSFIKIKTLKTNKKTIERCIKESKGFLKIFKQHLFGDNLELIQPDIVSSFVTNEALNSLCNLSDKTLDKLIHSENKVFSEEINKSKLKDSFEILGIDKFITPPYDSKLVAANRSIELKKGNKFDFTNVLKPYFRDTSRLIIYDRYLRNRNRGFVNLIRILDLCGELSKCEIYTLSSKNNEINKFDIEYEDFKKELKQRFGENKIQIFSTSKHRRRIITDDFEIRIDPGLDFVNKNYICESSDVDIQIQALNK